MAGQSVWVNPSSRSHPGYIIPPRIEQTLKVCCEEGKRMIRNRVGVLSVKAKVGQGIAQVTSCVSGETD